MCIRDRLLTNQKNVIFLLSSLHFAFRLVLYLYACAVENPEIPGLFILKSIDLDIDCAVSPSKYAGSANTKNAGIKKVYKRLKIESGIDIYFFSLRKSFRG